MKITLTLTLSLILNSVISQTNPGLAFGGNGNDKGITLCLTNDGGYILAGTTRSFGAGSEDFYLIKLNALWQPVWSDIFGGLHQDFVRSIISTDDGFIVLGDVWDGGNQRLGMYMSLIDTEGNEVWDKQFGTHMDDRGFSAIETYDGDFVLLGYSRGFEQSGDIYIVKTDYQGNLIWQNSYGYDRDDYAMGIVENEDGSLMIIGTKNGFFDDVHANYERHDADILLLKIDTDGNEIWKKTYGEDGHDFGYSIEHADDGYYLFGSTQSWGEGSFDMILTKVDNMGEKEWHATYGGEHYEYGISIDKNLDDELFLLGSTKSFGQENSVDIYLIKTDNLGHEIWSLTIGGEGADFGQHVIATNDSGCAIIGTTLSYGAGQMDMLFVKINKYGEIEQISNTNNTNINELVIAPNPMHDNGRLIMENNNADDYTLEICTLAGIVVKKCNLSVLNTRFRASSLLAGMYVYKLTNNNNRAVLSGKLVIY
ncbi:MAG: T9SS type A sorting domain-containing protein [Bacteroidetes bacterium]|nr:T9SS type A sorting domain-containing protein [Bacteroidota bacterium]MBL6944250.1 T9SS type A sorting domain-containing protein [Bacteroidales bacterium]